MALESEEAMGSLYQGFDWCNLKVTAEHDAYSDRYQGIVAGPCNPPSSRHVLWGTPARYPTMHEAIAEAKKGFIADLLRSM